MAELKLGYKASAEQFAPRELVELAVAAEAHGMDSATVSDHFQPWRHEGGHAPFSLAWMTAVGERTKRLVLGTSVLTPTFRYNPAVIAQAFATMGCLYPDRIFLGVGTGESLNEIATGYEGEWPEFKERYARLRESVRLMRELWLGDRVDFEGEYYKTKGASIYDVPEGGIPIYIAAGGPQVAKYAGRAGDGFICTSGKGEELYKDKLIPAMKEGAEAAGKDPDDVDRMIEIKISYDTDPELALENTRFWAPLSLTAEQKTNIHDPLEMEKAADELPIEQVAKRWIVASDPDEAVAKVKDYVDWGLNHLVFHAPGPRSAALPRAVQARSGAAAAQAGVIWQAGTRASTECRRPSTSRRRKGTPASRRSRWASCTGWRRPSPRWGCSGPITRMGEDRDYILELLLAHTTAGLSYDECVGVGYQQLHDDPDSALVGDRRPLPPGRRALRRRADRRQRLHRRRVAQRAVGQRAHRRQPRRARSCSRCGPPTAPPTTSRTSSSCAWPRSPASTPTPPRWSPTAATRPNSTAVAEALEARSDGPKSYVLPEEPLLVAPSVAELRDAVHGTVHQRRRGPAEPRGARRAGRGHDRRARAGAADARAWR